MIASLPRSARKPLSTIPRKARPQSISQILREAYRRHAKEKITLLAVKRYLG